MKSTIVTLGALLAAGLLADPAQAQRRDPEEEARARRERLEQQRERQEQLRADREEAARRALERARGAGWTLVTPGQELRGDRAVVGVLLGEATEEGIRIDEVTPGGPADRAGLRAGDYIVGIEDVELRLQRGDADDPYLRDAAARRLTRALERLRAGDEVTLRVDAQGRSRTVELRTVRADELEPARATAPSRAMPPSRAIPRAAPRAESRVLPRSESRTPARDRATLGLSITSTGTARDTLGAFVASVVPDGPAERAGIVEGARIISIEGVELRAERATRRDRDGRETTVTRARTERLEEALRDRRPGDEVTLRVYQDGEYRTVRVRTGSAADVYRDSPMGMLNGVPFTFPEFDRAFGERFGREFGEAFGPNGRLRIFADSGAGVWRIDPDGTRQRLDSGSVRRDDDGTIHIESLPGGGTLRIERRGPGEVRVERIGPDGRRVETVAPTIRRRPIA